MGSSSSNTVSLKSSNNGWTTTEIKHGKPVSSGGGGRFTKKKKKKKNISVEPRDDNKLIEFYKQDRRFITVPNKQQKSEEKKSDNDNNNNNNNELIVRIMSYNILADGTRYALSSRHNYCPQQYRKWNYRWQSIICQLKAYSPDIVCIQESTPSSWKKKMKQPLKKLGYNGIHAARELFDAKMAGVAQSDCLIYKENKYELIKQKIIRFSDFIKAPKDKKNRSQSSNKSTDESKSNNNDKDDCYKHEYDTKYDKLMGSNKSMFRSFCKACDDVAIVLHLKCKQTNKDFIVTSSHFFWDPKNPEVKSVQALVFNNELERLLTTEWTDLLDDGDINSIPIIFGVDSNSLPFKAKKDQFDPDLPTEGARSGVYELMVDSKLSKLHKDHPFTRINNREKRYMQAHQGQNKMSTQEIEYVGDLPDWEIGIKWRSVYSVVNQRNENKEPLFTNRVQTFTDTLDYLFISNKCEIRSFLEMPWQKELTYHILGEEEIDDVVIKKELETEIKLGEKFPFCPNKDHPSDHLPLCADIAIL